MCGGKIITPKKTLKYSGIWLNDSLSFQTHVIERREKAERSLVALTKMMPNVGGDSKK